MKELMANARILAPNCCRQRTALIASWIRRIRDSNLLPFSVILQKFNPKETNKAAKSKIENNKN